MSVFLFANFFWLKTLSLNLLTEIITKKRPCKPLFFGVFSFFSLLPFLYR
nr:MAG TPA: hypothetical protein [Caudoviricetes sp.]